MVDFFVIKIAEPVMNCKVLKGVLWKWQIQLSSIKQMAIRKAQLAKSEFNRALHLSSKSQAGFLQLQLSAITQDGIPEVWETITKFIELTKSNDYFNENAWNRTNIDARGYQRTIEG
jgi:LAO/AO transport system kinase